MFRPVMRGGLRGLILASAASLMFGSASSALQWGDNPDDGAGDPQPEEETTTGSALEDVIAARNGADASAAAKRLRNDRPGGRP